MPLTPEQQELRSRGIGASEAAAACGLSPWMSPFDLYQLKRGEAPPIEETEEMEFGSIVEPAIAKLYERRHGVALRYPLPTVQHPRLPFVFATGDAEESPEVGVELKSMDFFYAREVDTFGLAECAPQYVCQAQHQMECMGWQVVKLVALVQRKLRVWEIERNDDLIGLILEREADLWARIESGNPPPINLERSDALDTVKRLYRSHQKQTSTVVRLSDDAGTHWEAYERLGKEINAAEDRRKAHMAAVLLEIGDNLGGLLPGEARLVKRIPIAGGPVSYVREPHFQTRAVKWKGDATVVSPDEPETAAEVEYDADFATVADRMHNRILAAGFLCNHHSPSGSRYYVHATEPLRIRLSDHRPDDRTREWMARAGCVNVQFSGDAGAVRSQVESVLKKLEGVQHGAE